MTCNNPLDAALLADYWITASDDTSIEEHLLSCDHCCHRLREIAQLAEAIRDLARSGSLLMTVPDAFIDQIAAEGLRVREYTPPRNGSIACTVSADDDFLIGRLTADLTAARRLDLSLCDASGLEHTRLADIPFRADAPSIVFQQPIAYAKAAPSETLIARLLSLDESGTEHLLGEYTFHHTRTIPTA